MFDLTGKCALITGASGGVGRAIAKALHAQGASVALHGTRIEALEALAGELKERTHVVACNLTDTEGVENWCPMPKRPWGSWIFWSTMQASPAMD